MNTVISTPQSVSSQVKPKKGCFFYGCVTVIALGVAVVVSLWAFFAFVVKPMIGKIAAPQSVAVAPLTISPERSASAAARVKTFGDAVLARQPVEPLVLDETDLNALVASVPELKSLAENVRLAIANDVVKGEFAFPLDDFGFSGKFLNLKATFKVILDYGVLLVAADTVEINGAVVPETYMAEIRRQNLAKDIAQEPAVARVLSEIKTIEVKGGAVVITPK